MYFIVGYLVGFLLYLVSDTLLATHHSSSDQSQYVITRNDESSEPTEMEVGAVDRDMDQNDRRYHRGIVLHLYTLAEARTYAKHAHTQCRLKIHAHARHTNTHKLSVCLSVCLSVSFSFLSLSHTQARTHARTHTRTHAHTHTHTIYIYVCVCVRMCV